MKLLRSMFPAMMLLTVSLSAGAAQETGAARALQRIDKLLQLLDDRQSTESPEDEKNSEPQPGDIIMMIDKETKNVTHGVIYQPNTENNKNIIGSVLSGTKYTNLREHLHRHQWDAEIFRYNPKQVDEKEKASIRKSIGAQALFWIKRINQESRNFYRYDALHFYLAGKFHENLSQRKKCEETRNKYSKTPTANTFLYLKYAVRQNTLPSLNKGFACSQFVLACLGTGLLKSQTASYCLKDQAWEQDADFVSTPWPSLKHKGEKEERQDLPVTYQETMSLLEQDRLVYERKELQKFLEREYGLDLKTSDKCIKDFTVKAKHEKVSLFKFLSDQKVKIKEEVETAQQRLANLVYLSPKAASLEEIRSHLAADKETWEHIIFPNDQE